MRAAVLSVGVMALGLAGCGQRNAPSNTSALPAEESPREAWEAIAADAEADRFEAIYDERLTDAARARCEELARKAAAFSKPGPDGKKPGGREVFVGLGRKNRAKDPTLWRRVVGDIREEGDRATVVLRRPDGTTAENKLVREGGRWKWDFADPPAK